MRVIYPDISANEYIEIVKKDKDLPRKRKAAIYSNILLGICMYLMSFIVINAGLMLFARDLSIIGTYFMAALISLVPGTAVFLGIYLHFRNNYDVQREPVVFDKELMSYYRLCDCLRINGLKDVSMHLIGDDGDKCSLDLTYKENQVEKKTTLNMKWHVSQAINDVVIDFDRRDVAVPKNMCEVIEAK